MVYGRGNYNQEVTLGHRFFFFPSQIVCAEKSLAWYLNEQFFGGERFGTSLPQRTRSILETVSKVLVSRFPRSPQFRALVFLMINHSTTSHPVTIPCQPLVVSP